MDKITKSIRRLAMLFFLSGLLITGLFNVQKHSSYAEGPQPVSTIAHVINTTPEISKTNVAPLSIPEAPKPNQPSITSEVLGLKIDAININIPLGQTILDSNRALMVPKDPTKAAWYKNGPKPGDAGTALITGHLDSAAGPGVFYDLGKLVTGNLIEIKRDDGKIVTYQVVESESYPQDITFPWDKVYATSGPSGLRIITCDGVYSPKTGRYSRNLVVYADLVSVR